METKCFPPFPARSPSPFSNRDSGVVRRQSGLKNCRKAEAPLGPSAVSSSSHSLRIATPALGPSPRYQNPRETRDARALDRSSRVRSCGTQRLVERAPHYACGCAAAACWLSPLEGNCALAPCWGNENESRAVRLSGLTSAMRACALALGAAGGGAQEKGGRRAGGGKRPQTPEP